jgi:hypothetical protein
VTSAPSESPSQGYDVTMPPRQEAMSGRPRGSALIILIGLAAVSLSTLGGCQRALFPKKAPRTQFETYDLMRQRYVPLEEPDVFGEPKPALRARLGSN